jgi:16S rRNA pseudouridine516 synthase
MSINRSRLDRFISSSCNINRKKIRLYIAQKRIEVDGKIATSVDQLVDNFSRISFDNQVLQDNQTRYIMLHKPTGVVSATTDDKHKTVIDLLPYSYKSELHIVGRLDLNTSGLILLTNDSRWSELLTKPENKVAKRYRVTLSNPLSNDYIEAFEQGMYFNYEDITTLPVKLEIISPYVADVILYEGRYHQIKRMFGRFRNPVMALHRYSIGGLNLENNLNVGDSRLITPEEIATMT